MQEKLKLEVGKSYRTRGGLKATVTGYEPTRGRYPFIGRVDDEAFSWTNDGRFIFSSKPDSFDLIAPWEEDMAIQPVEFCQKNGLNYCESNVVKYVCRHRSKNGRQDIEKAIHYLQLLLEMEYQEKTERVSL